MSKALAKRGTAELLTAAEAQTLAAHEAAIRRGMATFVDVGNALTAIRDAKLYREGFDTFEDYCRERWGFAKSQAYRLIDSAGVVAHLSPMGDVPQTERQARPLAKLPAEQQPIAWQAATAAAAADSRPVTAKDVAKAVQAIVRESNPEPKEDAQQTRTRGSYAEWDKLRDLCAEVKTALDTMDTLKVDANHRIAARDLCQRLASRFADLARRLVEN